MLQPKRLAQRLANGDSWICQSCLRGSVQASRRSYTSDALLPSRTPDRRCQPLASTEHTGQRTVNGAREFSLTSRANVAPRRQPVLPDGPARTRFAPSPTGHLHIGGLRTAFFSYLLAKRTGGQFLLRIEDTDQKRLVQGAEQRLLEDLQWAGLQWDEGPEVGGAYGSYKQSERNDVYQEHARDLLSSGMAYRCFCTPQAAGQSSAAYVTSGCHQQCASMLPDKADERAEAFKEPFTVRLRRPEHGNKRVYPDLIYGKITPLKRSATALASADADSGADAADTILIKSDGTPTYHFANVVDDHLMKITHVIRGTEWMASTPLHYDLYHAFGWTPPAFAHVGLLVDEKKAKLSKRNSDLALDVRSMRDEHGVLPDTLVNFLALLGWSNPTDNDVMDMQQLVQNFDLKFTKGNTMVRMEKLWFLQKHHVARRCEEARTNQTPELVEDLAKSIAVEVTKQSPTIKERFPAQEQLQQHCVDILLADSTTYHNARQYALRNRYFFSFDPVQVPTAQAFYDKESKISGRAVADLVEAMPQDFDFRQPYRGASSDAVAGIPATVGNANELWFEKANARIHAAMTHHVWAVALDDLRRNSPSPLPSLKAKVQHLESDALHFIDKPFDEAAFVHSFIKSPNGAASPEPITTAAPASGGAGGGLEVDAVLQRRKAWNTAIMRYLREKLSYGLPGPSIGVVMALLGYEECCKRLGVRAREGGGWA